MKHDEKLESFLYRVIEEVSKENAPIVFCGALALKDLLYLNNPDFNIDRKTTDIDANWCEIYDQTKIINIFDNAVKKINDSYRVELFRTPADRRSMGLSICDDKNIEITKIDINIKENPFYVVCNINDTNIKYSSFEKIMADKLYSITNEHVYRRIKDLLDIYMIISNNDVNFEKIKEILEYDNRILGDCSTLLNNRSIIESGYNSLIGITNKPKFSLVWNQIISYLEKNNIIDNYNDNYIN